MNESKFVLIGRSLFDNNKSHIWVKTVLFCNKIDFIFASNQ